MTLIDQHPTTSPAPTITPIAPTREVAPQPAAAPGPRAPDASWASASRGASPSSAWRLRDGLALADTDWRDALMLTRGTPFDLSGQDWQDVLDDELGSAPQD
ncbi:hypothetical protein [Ornithinimicrobium panacihumi]|uniref:hypothetical protein n=1 Tax=Ornithinimicrobium panacihumi TaxID=2008449 RepID=UPI003F8B8BC4